MDDERGIAAEPPPPEPAEKSEEQPGSAPLWLTVLAVLVLGGAVELIIYGYVEKPGWIGSSGKQFWDYLDLLIVPAALALVVYWLNRRQGERDQQAEDAQQARALAVESQRAQDEALQAHLDQMSHLLTDAKRPLRRARPSDDLSIIARARILTVLLRLDGERKARVVQFLYESNLIARDHPVLALASADLSKAKLNEADLRGAYLRGADLSGTNLSKASLYGADLREAKLFETNLSGARLYGTNLSKANLNRTSLKNVVLAGAKLIDVVLNGADLRGANLSGADLNQSDLNDANLSGANLGSANLYKAKLNGANLKEATLSWAHLSEADLGRADLHRANLLRANLLRADLREAKPIEAKLIGANLQDASLYGADLEQTNLHGANLQQTNPRGANLRGANLRQAKGFANDALEQQAASLEGATMPNGQKYEDWRKAKEAHGEDGEYSGPS